MRLLRNVRLLRKLQSASPAVLLVSCLCCAAVLFGAAYAGLGMIDRLRLAHKPAPKGFAASAPKSWSLDEGSRMLVHPDKECAGPDGHAPMAPDSEKGLADLQLYRDAWGPEGSPQLRTKSDPALRKRLVKEGRILLLDPETHVIEVNGGFDLDVTGIYVSEGPYEGARGIVFGGTLGADPGIFAGVKPRP